MVDRDRVAVLWVPYAELAGLLTGKFRLVELPEDAEINGVGVDFSRDAVGLRVLSNSFPKIVPGEQIERIACDVETVPPDTESAILTEIKRLRADLRCDGSKVNANGGEDWHSIMQRWEEEFRLLQAAYPSQNIPLQEVGA